MRQILHLLTACCLIFFATADAELLAQKKKKKKGQEEQTPPPKKEDKGPKKIADAIKKHDKIDGLFTFYRDSVAGGLKMIVREDQLNKEYIHFYYYENGITQGRMNKGSFRGSKIFKIQKYYNKLEFITQNNAFYFDPENPLSRAADANVSNAVMFSAKIEAGSPKEKKERSGRTNSSS